jgi:hypothetical protein
MTFAESPLSEDEGVAVHEAQRFVECRAGARRENHICECAMGSDRLDRPTAADPPCKQIA